MSLNFTIAVLRTVYDEFYLIFFSFIKIATVVHYKNMFPQKWNFLRLKKKSQTESTPHFDICLNDLKALFKWKESPF